MKKTFITTWLLGILLFLVCLHAQHVSGKETKSFSELSPKVQTLYGVKGCKVKIVELSEYASQLGLYDFQLMQDIEVSFRAGKIRLLTDRQAKMIPDEPCLWIVANVLTSGSIVAYNISIRFNQRVSLLRDSAFLNDSYYAVTWITGGTGLVSLNNDPAKVIRQDIRKYVEEFINDFREANPKK